MDELDPDRGWLVNGAKFLKTRNGKNHSLDSLHEIFNNLERERRNSPYFRVFVERRDRGYPYPWPDYFTISRIQYRNWFKGLIPIFSGKPTPWRKVGEAIHLVLWLIPSVGPSSNVDQSITTSQAALSLSDFWLSDHTRNYVSTYRIFAPAR